MSQAERDVHHRIKSNAPLQQRYASNRATVKSTTGQDVSKGSHTKSITQDTASKILETTSDVQDTKVRNRILVECVVLVFNSLRKRPNLLC